MYLVMLSTAEAEEQVVVLQLPEALFMELEEAEAEPPLVEHGQVMLWEEVEPPAQMAHLEIMVAETVVDVA